MSEATNWKRLRSTLLLDRWPWLRVYADDVELPDGTVIEGFLRVESRPHAQIFALTHDGQVPFVRQYKYGPGRTVLQLPAGYMEEGEAPEECARRELLEETGYEASEWRFLGALCQDGNRGFGIGHFFLARGARAIQPPDPGDDERLTLQLVALAEVPRLLISGELAEAGPTAGIALALAHMGLIGTEQPS